MLRRGEPDIEVVGEAGNGAEAVTPARRELPDVVLMDVRMPVMDGLEATRRITGDASLGGTRVVILTTFDLDEYVHDGLRAGASGFLLKDTLPADLLNAVRVVADGDALICAADHPAADRGVRPPTRPDAGRRRARSAAHRPRARGAELVAQGDSNAEIAAGSTSATRP